LPSGGGILFPPDIDLNQIKKIAYEAAAVAKYVYLIKPIAIIFKNEFHESGSLIKMRLKASMLDLRYEFPFITDMTEIVLQQIITLNLLDPDELMNNPIKNHIA